jgi:copper chaperone CopZ
VAGAIVFGLLIDYLLPASWFGMERMNHSLMHSHHHGTFSWFNAGCSIFLTGLIIHAFLRKSLYSLQLKNGGKMATIYKIGGMTCNHCKTSVETNLAKLSGVASVKVDLEKSLAYIEGTPDDAQIRQTVETLGYEYKGRGN